MWSTRAAPRTRRVGVGVGGVGAAALTEVLFYEELFLYRCTNLRLACRAICFFSFWQSLMRW